MRYISILSLLFILFSCEFDYNIDKDLQTSEPQAVLNSTIAPDKPIEILLIWNNRYYGDGDPYQAGVASFDIKIYEDDKLILDSIGKKGVLETNIYPKAGSSYSLEVEIPYYGKITAQTYIPSKPYKVRIDSIKRVAMPYDTFIDIDIETGDTIINFTGPVRTYFHYEINKIDISEQTRAFWIKEIRSEFNYTNDNGITTLTSAHWEISITNPYLDQLNVENNLDYVSESGSVINHTGGFLRVPFKNLSKVFPINLSVWRYGVDTKYSTISIDSMNFSIITPSDDYDRYYRDLRKQQIYGYKPSVPLFTESVYVHTNINGGLGIFAGYLEEVERIKYQKPSKK